MKIRNGCEQLFAGIARSSVVNPWRYIATAIIILFFAFWQLGKLETDTTTEGFFDKDAPELARFNAFNAQFGRDISIILAIRHADVADPRFMANFSDLHSALSRQVPFVDRVDSLINANEFIAVDDEIQVRPFFDGVPDDESALKAKQEKQEKLQSNPLYRNIFLSADGEMAVIYIRPAVGYLHDPDRDGEGEYRRLGRLQIHQMILAIRAVVDDSPAFADKALIAGTPVIADELSDTLVRDMLGFVCMAMLVISTVLYWLFRCWWGVVLPLVVVGAAVISTMALMALLGQPLQSPTVILPSFILSVGVSDAIHVLSLFRSRLMAGEAKAPALEQALSHCGVPIFFTVITAGAGLVSFGGSGLVPIANLGWFTAIGIAMAFLYTVLLLPALITLVPMAVPASRSRQHDSGITAVIRLALAVSSRMPGLIVMVSAGLTLVALYSAMQLQFSHDPVKWLPESSHGRMAMEEVSAKLGGTVAVEIMIDTQKVDGIKNAGFMHKLDEAVQQLAEYENNDLVVGNVIAVSTWIKELNRLLLSNTVSDYAIPADSSLLAQEFLVLEMSGADELAQRVSSDYSSVRVTVLTPWVDALVFDAMVEDMQARLHQKFSGEAVVEVTGSVPILASILKTMMHSSAYSYLFAFVVITCMMVLLTGSLRYGLLSVVPNILPVVMVLGIMQVMGAPLDMFSMLIGAIAMGLAVDDTVHFIDGFRQHMVETGNVRESLEATLDVSGRAMLSTGTVLSSGFLIYVFSPMSNLQDFGIYTALCIAFAVVADFFITPSLLFLLHKEESACGKNR